MVEKTKFGLGVFVCIFNKEISKILLIKRNEEKRIKYGGEWGNVGGKINFGETSEEASIREASEEIGITLDKANLKLLEVMEIPNSPFYREYHVVHFVYAISIPEDTKIKINHESDGFKWFNLNNLPESMLDKKEDILRFSKIAKSLLKK